VFSERSAPMAVHSTVDTATEERCLGCGPSVDVITRTISECSGVSNQSIRGLLQFSRCQLLLLDAGS
jgi:hypothetical protein